MSSEEFQTWERAAQLVIEHLKARRDHPEEEENKKYKIMILIMPGGMRGAYSMGQVLALNEMGITSDKVDSVVAVSGGAGPALSYLDNPDQAKKTASIWYDECADKEFLDEARVGHLIDSQYIGHAFRVGEKAVNVDTIISSRPEFYVAVTQQDLKKAKLIDVKTATHGGKKDIVSAIEATMNIPLFAAPGIEVDGEKYIDGDLDILPVKELIKRFEPTDIVVLPNIPLDQVAQFKPNVAVRIVSYLFDKDSIIRKWLKSYGNFQKNLKNLQSQKGVRIAVMWPPDCGITALSNNPDDIRMTIVESARAMMIAFGEEPKSIELYEPRSNSNIVH